jgi:hypothetical protein
MVVLSNKVHNFRKKHNIFCFQCVTNRLLLAGMGQLTRTEDIYLSTQLNGTFVMLKLLID